MDHLDLFRAKDIILYQSLIDRILNIGRLTIVSRDASHPGLLLKGIIEPRYIYDKLKIEIVNANKRRGGIHLES